MPEISRRDFVIVTGTAAAAVVAPRGAAQAETGPTSGASTPSALGGDPDVRHETAGDTHVFTDVHGRHRLEIAPGTVAFDTPMDTPLRTSVVSFERGEGHDRIRAALGDETLQRALAILRLAPRR